MADVTFVTPRYGREVLGGAESGARSLATRLAAEGWAVEVLTSCARSARLDWADEYPQGTTLVDGVTVHRFGVARPRDPGFAALSQRILAEPRKVDRAAALDWIDRQGPDSPDLIAAVASVTEGVLALYPYLYQPSVRGAAVAVVPTVLHPAGHTEPPLGLRIFDELFASVAGLAFHTRAEQSLVAGRFPGVASTPQVVLGLAVDGPEMAGVVDEATTREQFELGEGPVVVCLGRVDPGKGSHQLVAMFAAAGFAATGLDATLVLAGPVAQPTPPTRGVRVLGPVSEQQKWGLLATADVLVQPSPLESFSLVLAEAWLAGTPVLVNGLCAPLLELCADSGGGLWYTGLADFRVALKRLLSDPEARQRLALAGGDYVRSAFAWPAVRSRYEALLSRIL